MNKYIDKSHFYKQRNFLFFVKCSKKLFLDWKLSDFKLVFYDEEGTR